VKNHRPKNLNLFSIRFPIPAIVSILHRISGVILFLATPLVIWALSCSLDSQDSFQNLQDNLSTPLFKILAFGILSPFLYHFIAGIRHLLMDVNIGVSLKSGRASAFVTLILAIVTIVLAGIYLW